MIVRYGLLETIDEGHFYGSVTEGVDAFGRESGDAPAAAGTKTTEAGGARVPEASTPADPV